MSEVRVTYQPIGRLGNQMFQCAAAIGYAKKYGVKWACPNDTKEVPRFHEFFQGLPKYDGHEFKRFNAADPAQFNYSPIPEHTGGVKLVGFFQSEKYFEGAHDEVRRVFKLDIKPVDAVSIHVRRGDYVQYSNSFPPIDDNYLQKAIEYICEETGLETYILFSDDYAWAKEWAAKNSRFDIKISMGDEFNDLSLMASCSHHIIANSTFSWWGAWLGHNTDKVVVSPHYENWFGPGFTGSAPKDLIPPSWHQIKFR